MEKDTSRRISIKGLILSIIATAVVTIINNDMKHFFDISVLDYLFIGWLIYAYVLSVPYRKFVVGTESKANIIILVVINIIIINLTNYLHLIVNWSAETGNSILNLVEKYPIIEYLKNMYMQTMEVTEIGSSGSGMPVPNWLLEIIGYGAILTCSIVIIESKQGTKKGLVSTDEFAEENQMKTSSEVMDSSDNSFDKDMGVNNNSDTNSNLEEAEGYSIELVDVGTSVIQVIKIVREETGLGLAEVKNLVDKVPSIIVRNVSHIEASTICKKLERVGAFARII